jgi:hypothetical protein
LPCFSEDPSSGFGYPLGGLSRSQPWKLLTSNALGILSSEFYSFSMIEKSFLFFFPLLRFLPRPSGFGPVLQRFIPIKKAVPLFATSKNFRGGVDYSLEISNFSGIFSAKPIKESSPFLDSPLALDP